MVFPMGKFCHGIFLLHSCDRKHHCQVHHISTNTLMMDQELKTHYNPMSDYKATFHPLTETGRTKRGMAVPARILSDLNSSEPMDNLTMTRKDFIPKPLKEAKVPPKQRGNKPKLSNAPFHDSTSYKTDFPKRKRDPNPMSDTLMRTTLPKIVEVGPEDVYCTTNQETLKQWQGNCRSESYKELQEKPFFSGKIDTETMMKKDFKTVKNAKPSKSCKKIETHKSAGDFNDSTTNKSEYKLPPLTKKKVMFSKNNSQKMVETMEPFNEGNNDYLTQYQRDTSNLLDRSVKRGYCPPEQDKLNLFHGDFDHKTVTKASFNPSEKMAPPKHVQKKANDISNMNPMNKEGEKFYDETTTNTHFQPVSIEKQALGISETREINFKISKENKASDNIKRSQNFGLGQDATTVNQSEYFKFQKAPRRKFHGDAAERLYFPSSSKFDTQSETKDSFVMKTGKRADPFKPLDKRFQKKVPLYSKKMTSETSYKRDYVPLPLPKPELCPAEHLIRQS